MPPRRAETRRATNADFCRYWKRPPSKEWLGWVGMVAEDPDWTDPDDRYLGFGGAYWSAANVAVAFVEKRRPIPALLLHRQALTFLGILKEVGERRLFTGCDDTIKNAARWLGKLGFRRVSDEELAALGYRPWNGEDSLWLKEF